MFAMARVGRDVLKEFQEVNSLYEKGSLKSQCRRSHAGSCQSQAMAHEATL